MYKIKLDFGLIFADIVCFVLTKISGTIVSVLKHITIFKFNIGAVIAFPFSIIGAIGEVIYLVLTAILVIKLIVMIVKRVKMKNQIKELESGVEMATSSETASSGAESSGVVDSVKSEFVKAAKDKAAAKTVDVLKKLSGF